MKEDLISFDKIGSHDNNEEIENQRESLKLLKSQLKTEIQKQSHR